MRPLAVPRERSGRFVNWAGTARGTPSRWHLPASETEVADVVGRARAGGRRLRVVGAGHSFSRIAVPDDEAMTLDHLAVPMDVDREAMTVTVSAGMRLRDLTAGLARHGLALPVVGSIQAQSVAGAIATGTHGSSLQHGNLASLVTALRLVTGTGEAIAVDVADPRFDGVRVHLGALGVLTQVTLRVRAAGFLHQSIEQVPVHDVAGLLGEIAGSAEYVKAWWLPHAPQVQVIRYTATTDPATRRPSAATQRWVDERVLHRFVFPAMVGLQHRRPAMTAGLNAWLSTRYLGAASQVGRDALMLNTPMPIRHRETEAALPLASAPEALEQVLALFRRGRPAANFPLEVRFVRGDAMWLSPAQGADTCQIGAYTTNGPDCSPYFDAFWRVMRPLGARPHWGKELDHDAIELRELYPEWDRFQALRDELDPDRVFSGPFHRRILGD